MEMTDNKIVKALEKAAENRCDRCSFNDENCEGEECEMVIAQEILTIINRQKAEIERFRAEEQAKFDKWKLLDKRTKERYAELYEEAKGVVRAEAIKEFAERFIETFEIGNDRSDRYLNKSDIYDLAKEVTGGD